MSHSNQVFSLKKWICIQTVYVAIRGKQLPIKHLSVLNANAIFCVKRFDFWFYLFVLDSIRKKIPLANQVRERKVLYFPHSARIFLHLDKQRKRQRRGMNDDLCLHSIHFLRHCVIFLMQEQTSSILFSIRCACRRYRWTLSRCVKNSSVFAGSTSSGWRRMEREREKKEKQTRQTSHKLVSTVAMS